MSPDADPCVLVYDVGGSHISAAICHKDAYRLSSVDRANLPEEQSSAAFMDVLHTLGMQASEGADGVQGAEFAMPVTNCTSSRKTAHSRTRYGS